MDIPVLSPIFGWLIKNLYNIFGQNYLLTLFLFALVIKFLLLPFGIKQQKNSIKQAKMRPKEMAIRKKYAGRNDRATQQKMQEEIMKLYQEENVNPMSGCLPLLIQMPVLFALYGVIIKPITYISSLGKDVAKVLLDAYNSAMNVSLTDYQQIEVVRGIVGTDGVAEKVGAKFAELASAAELNVGSWDEIVTGLRELYTSFNVFGIDMTVTPTINFSKENIPYLLIPVLTFVFAFFSTKIIRKFTYQPTTSSDPAQARSLAMMDWMMPLMSVYISFRVSSAIAVYWMFQNILGAVQQIFLYKFYPVPVITEEQIKEAELQLKKSNEKKKKEVKALDYEIDDYDKTTPEEKEARVQGKKDDKDRIACAKGTLSPKIKARLKQTGKTLKARKKI